MKRIFIISMFSFLASQVTGQNCMTLFSYGSSFETVQFFNQSEMSNAHYWWNFGDGTGSHIQNPVHTYPDNGRYLVTLFANDTVSNCSDYHELWINITKYSTDTCLPAMSDSVVIDSLNRTRVRTFDQSQNCDGLYVNVDGGPAFNFQPGNNINVLEDWKASLFLWRIQYYTSDTINGYEVHREAYKTRPVNGYSSAINYQDCSANFEFEVVSEDSLGQKWFFNAMNRDAVSYEWIVRGYGQGIFFYTDTMSFFFEFTPNDMRLIQLITESVDGCRDTVLHQILFRKGVYTTVGIEEVNSISEIEVFPNPFTERTTLKFENSKRRKHRLTLFNSTGQVVKLVNNITSGQVTIDRENLANGIYFYQLQNDRGQIATGKLIMN